MGDISFSEEEEKEDGFEEDTSWIYTVSRKLSTKSEDVKRSIAKEVEQRSKEICSKHGYVSPVGIAHSMGVSFEVVKDHLFKLGYREVKKNKFIPKEVDDLN